MAISPGGRPADDSPVGTPGGRQNWVDKAGGLPKYVRMVAHALMRKGMPKDKAIPAAVNRIKRWAAGLDNVRPQVQAAAVAAIAEWNAKKGAGGVSLSTPYDLANTALPHVWDEALLLELAAVDENTVDLSAEAAEFLDLAPGDYQPPYDWKHGYIPLTPAAAAVKAKKGPHVGSGKTRTPKGKRITAASVKKKAAKQAAKTSPALAKAKDDEQRGRGVPGAVTSAQNAANAAGPRKAGGPGMATTRTTTGDLPATRSEQASSRAAAALSNKRAHQINDGDVIHETSATSGGVKMYRVDKAYTPKADGTRNVDVTDEVSGRKLELTLDGTKNYKVGKGKPDATVTSLDSKRKPPSEDPRLKLSAARTSDSLHRGSKPTQAERSELTEKVQAAMDAARRDGKGYVIVKHQDRHVGVNLETGVITPYGPERAIASSDREKAGGVRDLTGPTAKAADVDPIGSSKGKGTPASSFPVGARVRAGVAGNEGGVIGKVVGHTDQGMLRVEYRNHRDETVTGTFNPSQARRTNALGGVDARSNKRIGADDTHRLDKPAAEREAQESAAGKPRKSLPGGGSYPVKADGSPDYGAMSAEQAATIRAKEKGMGVGDRVQVDGNPGTVTAVSTRGTTVDFDGPFPKRQIPAGTPGHDRMRPLAKTKTVRDADEVEAREKASRQARDRADIEWAQRGQRDRAERAQQQRDTAGSPMPNRSDVADTDRRAQERAIERKDYANADGPALVAEAQKRGLGGEQMLSRKSDSQLRTMLKDHDKNPAASHEDNAKARAEKPTSSTSSTNPDAPVRIEHTPDGTLVHGTERSDAPKLKAAGFKWSRNLNAWYLPRTWNESTRDQRVKRLEADMGGRAGVDRTTGPRKSAAEREAETRDRAAARADRMDARAEKRSAEATRRFEASDLREEKSGIPFGQPILSGHHSERKHRRAIERAHQNLGKGVEAQREADRASEAAERARRTAAGAESKTTIGNRIAKNERELRDLDRRLNGTHSSMGGKKPEGEYRQRLENMRADTLDQLEHDRGKMEARGGVPSKASVSKGDFVKIRGQWYPVQKSNEKTVGVPNTMIPGRSSTSPWHEVQEHRKAADVSREDVARMIQQNSAAFPHLKTELAKAAPAKKTDDTPVNGGIGPNATSEAARSAVKTNVTDADRRKLEEAKAAKAAGLSAGAATPGGITPQAAEKMTDAQLERAMERLMAAGTYDGPAFGILEAELDKRDRRRAEGNGPRR